MFMRLRLLAAICGLAAAAAPPARAADRLTVLLDWFVNPDHGPLLVAQETGAFADAGLTVDIKAPADPNDPPKLVAAGKADVAISYQPQLHLQVAGGLPLVRIATLVATPLNALVVLRSSPVRSIADLKGRTVGFSVSGFEDALLGTMLRRHGLALKDVRLVNVSLSLSASLISGKVDAVIGAFRNFELNQLALENRPGRAFYPEEEGVPPYDELILVANRQKLGDSALVRLIDAVERATHYLINHPEDAWRLFIKGRKELDNELNRRAWRDTLPRFALRPAALDRGRYRRFAAFLKDQGMIDTVPPLARYAVDLR